MGVLKGRFNVLFFWLKPPIDKPVETGCETIISNCDHAVNDVAMCRETPKERTASKSAKSAKYVKTCKIGHFEKNTSKRA
jgi:hypothetical protein